VSTAMILAVCAPLLGAMAAFVLPPRCAAPIGLGSVGVVVASVGWLARQLQQHGPQRYALGDWPWPVGIQWYVDGLSALMMAMTAGIMAAVSVYAASYFKSSAPQGSWRRQDAFWPLWLMLLTSFNVVFLSADIFNLYVGLELLGLAAVALVTLAGNQAALTAAMRYLVAAMVGSLAYLMGVALLYGQYGLLDMHLLGQAVYAGPATWAALALMTGGLMLKTALFPLHFWLPPAHANAPAPVSAALSALVVKASFYLLLRLWFEVFPAAMQIPVAQLIAVAGAVAIVGGSILAILQRRLKMLIAYSTVAQIGYLFLMPALMVSSAPLPHWNINAWTGGIYHCLSHALAKAAMFLAAGSITVSLGSDRIRQLRGMVTELPMVTFTFALAGISLIGLPPSGGFMAKWFLVHAAMETGQWWWAVVVLFGGLLAAMYVFLVLRYAFLPPAPPHFKPVPRAMTAAGFILALASMLLGLRGQEVFELLWIGAPLGAASLNLMAEP
jgi:multicomponent Na+:H+ antiporter subunit D